jgi:hypothetical protein
MNFEIVHQACWPTSSRHARLSAACLVGATSDNNLSDERYSMSIKTEIMSLCLAEEMIFGLCVRSRANCVGFYTIPYIRAHIFGVGSANARKHHRPMPERISSRTRSHRTWWLMDGKYLFLLYIWLNIIALIPIWQYFSMIWFLAVGWNIESVNLLDEAVNLWIFTVGLTSSGCRPNTFSIWPWSGMPKVRLYDTFPGGLRQICKIWHWHISRW